MNGFDGSSARIQASAVTASLLGWLAARGIRDICVCGRTADEAAIRAYAGRAGMAVRFDAHPPA